MSAFDRLEKIASRAVDRLNSDVFTLLPMKGGANARRARDMDRPSVTGRGVLDLRQVTPGIQLGSSRSYGASANDLRTLQHAQSTQPSCATEIFAGDLPRQGDVIQMKGQRYDVLSARPDGMSRVVLVLEGGAP